MNMTRTSSISLSILLAAAACDVSEPDLDVTPTLRSTPSEAQLEDTFCAAKRQLALLPANGACPVVAGWTGSKVFNGGGEVLSKFCKYDWNGGPGTLPNVDALRAAAGLLRVASDCGAVYDHSTEDVWDVVGPGVQDAFRHGIGLATAADLNLPATEGSRSNVMVAVIDTVPEPQPAQPRSVHGEFMARLINDIACPAEIDGCAVDVERSLGLPRYIEGEEFDLVDTVRGGTYGTQKDMAKAIYDSVETWNARGGAAWGHLILSLSVGWERDIFGDVDDSTPRPAVEAVYAAIQYARCHGALVIAAAGNQGSSCLDGPIAPAAWEQHPVPSNQRCIDLGAPTLPSGLGYAPLVYSIGGLTHDLERMATSRDGGMPRMAALATNAVAGNASRTATGTSVGPGVASGVAALIWSYHPGLSPSAVMSILYQTGTPTNLQADYSLPDTSALDVKAINVCAALEAACNLSSADCPDDPFANPLACLDREPVWTVEDLFDHLAVSFDNTVDTTIIGEVVPCEQECGYPSQAFIADASLPAECPEPSSMVRPYTLPQPTQVGCPNCTLDLTWNVVYASLDPAFEYKQDLISEVTVSVIDGQTARTTYFRYGALDLNVGVITKLKLDATSMPTSVRSASISITFTDGEQVVDPLLLGP